MQNKTKTTLVIIYNHNYERNIDRLEQLYKEKFDNIYHLMPFYGGDKPNVISVYNSSYQFCDYIRQGLNKFKNNESSHYCFIADDALLNPEYDQYNITEKLKLDEDTGFIPELASLDINALLYWSWTYTSILSMEKNPGCEFERFIPSKTEAFQCFEKHNIPLSGITKEGFNAIQKHFAHSDFDYYKHKYTGLIPIKLPDKIKYYLRKIFFKIRRHKNIVFYDKFNNQYTYKAKEYKDYYTVKELKAKAKGEPIYPLAGGFSDFTVIPHNKIDYFAHLIGVLSAANVFVEIATPTAMVLCLDKISTQKDIKDKSLILWGKDRKKLIRKNHSNLEELYKNWGDTLFVHPVKLSQWR